MVLVTSFAGTDDTQQDRVYSRGRSKYVAPLNRMVIDSEDERDPEYVPSVTFTPTRTARTTRDTPKKVAHGEVTAFQTEEERILTGRPYASDTHSKGASGLDEASRSEEASESKEAFGSEEESTCSNANAPSTSV